MSRKTFLVTPLIVFVLSFALFMLLRSNDFFSVDGSFRCLEVFRYRSLFFRSNNHLLYTPDVYGWTQLAAKLGYKPAGPVELLHLVEAMNCLAGAAALAIFSALILGVTDSSWIAVAATAGLGLTRAFFAQATNSNEPMPGILWSFAGIGLAALSLQKKSLWAAVMSGLSFGLAMASYRSMVLLAPAALLLLLIGNADGPPRLTLAPDRIFRTCGFCIATAASTAALHIWAYWTMGERNLRGLFSRFVATEGSEFYFGLRWSHVLNLPVGIARNFFAIEPEYTGIRALLSGPKSAIVVMVLFILAILGFLTFCLWMMIRLWTILRNRERLAVLICCTGFAFTALPVLLWDPQYDKLWVLPLACLIFLATIALKNGNWQRLRLQSIAWTLALVAVSGAGITIQWTFMNHLHDPIEFSEAKQAASIFGTNDFVIGDWRPVAMLYGYLYAPPDHFLSFPSEAVADGSSAVAHANSAVAETRARGGRVFFFDTLDMPRQDWNAFFGRIPGVPYSAFDEFRAQAMLRARFRDKHGYDNLWELK